MNYRVRIYSVPMSREPILRDERLHAYSREAIADMRDFRDDALTFHGARIVVDRSTLIVLEYGNGSRAMLTLASGN